MVTIADWQTTDARLIDEAIATEVARWRAAFAWDVSDAWQSIQPARAAGTLRGYIARDGADGIAGWTCYMLHQGTLQVAVLTARTAAVTEALVGAILESPEAQRADAYCVCVPQATPALAESLAAHGFDLVPYRYLVLALEGATAGGVQMTRRASPSASAPRTPELGPVRSHPFHLSDLPALVQLFGCAYPQWDDVRAFAPLGSEEEWSEYANSLVAGPGCGRIVIDASRVINSTGGRLDAAIIATDLGLGTGHIAQIAVDPDQQGRGFGAELVRQSIEVLARRGFARVTLLVSDVNTRARALYAAFGFRETDAFLVAVNRQPRRSHRLARYADNAGRVLSELSTLDAPMFAQVTRT
jgi:ribosomal protein S18 acetylase RimI-like enzyme